MPEPASWLGRTYKVYMSYRTMKGEVMNWGKIQYTLDHRKAFRKLEKELTGKVSISGWLHDLDKVFLLLFLNRKVVHQIHRTFSLHHVENIWGKLKVEQAIIDWECARFTKPDKPLTARETMELIYPKTKPKIEPVLRRLGL